MSMSEAQIQAFSNTGGFAPSALNGLTLGIVFALLLLWGGWAMFLAYKGWAKGTLEKDKFGALIIRFLLMYLVLGSLLLTQVTS